MIVVLLILILFVELGRLCVEVHSEDSLEYLEEVILNLSDKLVRYDEPVKIYRKSEIVRDDEDIDAKNIINGEIEEWSKRSKRYQQ